MSLLSPDKSNFRLSPGALEGFMVKGTFVAGVGGVTKGDVLRISAASTVLPVTAATHRVIGSADNTALAGQTVDVLVLGVTTLTADGAISAGDALGPTTTSGRCVAANSSTPTFTGDSNTTSAVSAGTPAGTNSALTFSGSQVNTSTPAASTACIATCNQNHPNLSALTVTAAGTINTPTFTGSALGTHTHSVTPTGTITGVNAGLVFGRAITAAAGAGSTFTAIIGI